MWRIGKRIKISRHAARCLAWVGIFVVLYTCANRSEPGPPRITVAAAANLANVFPELGRRFESATNIRVVYSFGSTASLAQQIESGAPFDVYASADVEHVDELIEKGFLLRDSRAVYARGRLVVWAPGRTGARIRRLEDLASPDVKFVGLAKPEVAPYGRAAVETLQALNLWKAVKPKVVYAQDVNMAKQFADSGNADAAFISLSLVMNETAGRVEVDPKLHRPIEQACAVVKRSNRMPEAHRFTQFLLGPEGQGLLERFGYGTP